MKKFLNLYAIMTIVTSFFFVLLVGYWTLAPYKVLTFEQLPFPVEKPSVKQGELLVYEVEYCKYMNLGATVSRVFVDGVLYAMPTFISNRETGCHDNKVYLEIPQSLPPSQYRLHIVYRFQVNPLRTIEVTAETEPFFVTK